MGFPAGSMGQPDGVNQPNQKIPLILLRAEKKASERFGSESCHEENLRLVTSPLLHAAFTCKPGVSQARKKVTQS
jgi:hypothetical protein